MYSLLPKPVTNQKSKLMEQFNQMKTSSNDPDFNKIKITTNETELILDITKDLYESFPAPSLEVSSPAGKTETAAADELQ